MGSRCARNYLRRIETTRIGLRSIDSRRSSARVRGAAQRRVPDSAHAVWRSCFDGEVGLSAVRPREGSVAIAEATTDGERDYPSSDWIANPRRTSPLPELRSNQWQAKQ